MPQELGQEAVEVALAEFSAWYDLHKEDKTAPYPGIARAVELLKAAGVSVAVLSNKAHSLAAPVVEHYFPGLFDAVAGHVLGTPTKPDPALLNGLMAQFGVQAGQVLYVGDSNVDIQTAQNAHVESCGLLWGFRTEEELRAEGASYLVHTPRQLADLALGQAEPPRPFDAQAE